MGVPLIKLDVIGDKVVFSIDVSWRDLVWLPNIPESSLDLMIEFELNNVLEIVLVESDVSDTDILEPQLECVLSFECNPEELRSLSPIEENIEVTGYSVGAVIFPKVICVDDNSGVVLIIDV